ncbi:MAG: hypothetical protein AAFV93_15695 [Chloroflexota bacterium]
MYQGQSAQRLFLFNVAHRAFVEGNESTFPTAVTRKIAVRQYVFLMFVIASPLILAITVLVAMAGYPVQLLLIVEIITALATCAYFVLKRYLKDRVLRYQGNIVYGEVVRHEVLPTYSGARSGIVTRIFYRFVTPSNERLINWVDYEQIANRLPDGRQFPDIGTPVAVLYANDKNHKLL